MKHKLLHYFESHPLHMVSSHGLGEIIRNWLTIGRIAKWALELMGLDITYVPQMVIKSQALVAFVAEWTETQQPPAPGYQRALEDILRCLLHSQWVGGGIVLLSPKGYQLLYLIRLHFPMKTTWRSMRPSTMAYASPPSLGSSSFISVVTLSLSPTKSWGNRTLVIPVWWRTIRRLESLRRSLMSLNFIISSGETMM
jgi:hypothetical protein